MQTPTHSKTTTVVANPIILWHFINPIAFLVNRDIAHTAKNNQIFVFVVAIVADGALCILLNNKSSLVSAQLLQLNVAFCSDSLGKLLLFQNHFICAVIFFLLPKF